MHPVRLAIAALLATATLGTVTAAPARSTEWTLRAGQPKRATPNPPPSTEEAERAARLAEGRRRFFENTPNEKPRTPGDFGGYDYRRDSGTMKPGTMFKF